MSYLIGSLVRLDVTFRDLSGAVADPTTVELHIQAPSGTVAIYTLITVSPIVKDDTGKYHFDLSLTAVGFYGYRWERTGAVQEPTEGTVEVTASIIGQSLPIAAPQPVFTVEFLAALQAAIASGTRRIRYKDREEEFQSMDDLMKAYTLVWTKLYGSTMRRQVRMRTRTGA